MKTGSNAATLSSSISQRLIESLSRIHLPFENLLLAWFLLSPVAAFFLRFPLDKSVITFDRALAFTLVLLLFAKHWQTIAQAQSERRATGYGLRTFVATKFEIAWLVLSVVALLNALVLSTNVSYAVKIAIDSFFLPLVLFHVARYQMRLRGRQNILLMAAIGLALFLFATGVYEFLTGANLFAYKGSTLIREGELRVNGPFASDSSYAIICLLLTLFLRLLPSLLNIKFDKSGRFVYACALVASAIATLLPLFRTVAVTLVLCWLAIEYFIHTKRPLKAPEKDRLAALEAGATTEVSILALPAGSSGNRLRRIRIYATIALLLFMSFAAWTEISGSYLIRRLASPRNLYGRLATWQTAARIAMENPVAGVGLTNYSEYFDVIFSDWQHQEVDWIGDIRAVETPHSNFLWIAAELGLSGFAPYLLACTFLLLMGLGALWRARSRQQVIASGGFLAVLAAYTISGLTLQSGFYADLNLYFFFMLGLLSAISIERHA
jgi:hypothetical protein